VVARSQYLGKMKRRTFLYSSAAQPSHFKLAADVIDSASSNVEGQIVGVGVSDLGATLLIETSTDVFAATQTGSSSLIVGDAKLMPLPQPYEFPVHESLKRVL
jgi:predicted transcriptional regulator with HTH domain